jgi:hypothetical protein
LLGQGHLGTISTMRARRLVAVGGLVLLLAMVAGCDDGAAPAGHASPPGSPVAQVLGVLSSSSSPSTPRLTDADYLRMAAQESERILRVAPLPSGSRRIPRKPAGWPLGGSGYSPSNSALTRTAWFSVPASAADVQRFLRTHHPQGMTDKEFGISGGNGGGHTAYRAVRARDPAVYTRPVLLVEWHDLGPRTVIRFDSALASRRARTPATYPSAPVTSIDVDRVKQSFIGGGSQQVLSTVRLSLATDPDRLHQVVAALGALYGSPLHDDSAHCPSLDDAKPSFTFRFVLHTANGDLIYDYAFLSCLQIVIAWDGMPIGVTLDPGDLYNTVTKILADLEPVR